MQKNFTIRPMNAENIRECADLFMRTFSKEPWNDVYESEEEVIRFFQRYLNNNCFTGYILTCKDSVIALCLGSRKPWLNGMEYEINQFCVAEAFQRQGVGSYFLSRIEETAGKCGMNAVVLNTNRGFPAEKFYRKNGYRILEESVVLAKQILSPEKTDSADRGKRKTCVRVKPRTIVMDCPDAASLAEFYSKLLGWTISVRQPDWVLMRNPDGGTGFSFQSEPGYTPPRWPEDSVGQQKMLHVDFVVENLQQAVAHALTCGAMLAPQQFLEGVMVFFDPAGHPFCFFCDSEYLWNEDVEK